MLKLKKHSLIFLIFFLSITLFTTSCWSRRELNDIAIIMGAAVDKAEEPDLLALTAQIVKPGQIGAAGGDTGGGGGTDSAVWNITMTGKTNQITARKMNLVSPRRPFWSHNKVFVFSEAVSREGIAKFMDVWVRDQELYPTLGVIIARGKAADLLAAMPTIGNVQSLNLAELLENQGPISYIASNNLFEFTSVLLSKTTSAVAAIGEVVEKSGQKIVMLTGTAVFKEGKLVGEINERETRGFLFLTGKLGSSTIVVDCLESEYYTSLEIITASGKITPQIVNDEITMVIEISILSDVSEQMCNENLFSSKMIISLLQRQNKVVSSEVNDVIKKAQEMNTDIFGFSDAIHKKCPKYWKQIEKDWDEIFPYIKTSVVIDSKMRRTGVTTRIVEPE